MAEPTPQPPQNLRQRVLRGGLIMSLVAVGLRASSFLAQLVLGRVLVDEEFGLYALALGFVTIQSAVRSVLRPVLIEAISKDPEEADHLFRTVLYGLMALAVVGAALSPVIGRLFDEPRLAALLVPMLLIMPLQLAPSKGGATISEAMLFGRVGRIEGMAGLFRHGGTVAAALLGFGAFSFVIGSVAATIAENVLVRKYLGSWPSLAPPDFHKVRSRAAAFWSGGQTRRWIWVSGVALALGASGDYLGASLTADVALVGTYFFAYQLTGALFVPMNLAASTVLVPAFTRIDEQSARRSSFFTTLRSLSVVGTLFFFSVAVVVAPLIHWLWGGRWDASIFAVIAFAAYAPIRVTHPSSQNIARACGYWSLFVSDMIAVGLITFAAAAVGARVGGLVSLVLFVLAGHLVVALSSAVRLGRRLGASPVAVLRVILQPWLAGLGALAIADRFGGGVDSISWADLPLRIVIMGVLLVLVVVIPERRLLQGLVSSLGAGKGGR